MDSNNFTLTNLSLNPEYFEEVIRLIEEGFHYSENQHYEKDFAPLVDPLNFENCFIYIDKESGEVAAHLAVCLRTLVKSEIETKVALIGGIVTHKKFRNKNLFKSLMDHALEMHKEKVSLFILWSDLEGLYERFLFYRTGGVVETGKRNLSQDERPVGFEKTKFSLLSEKEFENIIHLYSTFNQNYFFTLRRDELDWSIIKNMSSIDLYVKRNSAGGIQKYFCVNKGRDLTNVIHEVSCLSIAEYKTLLKELAGFKVWLPEIEAEKIGGNEIYYTAFMKLGDIKILNKFLAEVTRDKLVIKDINITVTFEFMGKPYEASQKDFLQYLLALGP